jgi:GTPase SAR1 family protein
MKGRSSVAFSLFAKVSFKILMVGAKDVGKTSLILRYIKKTFTKTKTAALGVEFYSNTI